MPAQETIYKIFIASPSGLNDERKAFFNVIEEYNKSDAVNRGVSFRAVGWEDTLAGMGRPQDLIDEDLIKCDFFLLLLHNRWGTNPGKNEQNATSGTEEEYRLAMECYKDENSHMKQIVCAFKSISPEQLADPGKQLEKVLEFKKELEQGKQLLYSSFFSLEEFQLIIRKQLGRWLLNHENDSKRNQKVQADLPIIPEETIHVERENIEEPLSTKDTEGIIKNAWKLANEGKLIDAEIEFSKALIYSPGDYELLSYMSFLMDIGQLDKALMMLDKVLEGENEKGDSANIATAYSYKGRIMETRGDLDSAEVMYKKALEQNEQLGLKKGVAGQYVNLGNLMIRRSDLDSAELMYKKSLEISEGLVDKENMAAAYGNLGVVMRMRGDIESAEVMYNKALYFNQALGNKKGMSDNYGNLGVIKGILHDLNSAEKMFKKSLEIEEQLGRKEGMASGYGNLGNVIYDRGDLDDAEEMYKKSLEIAKAHGFAEIIKIVTENLEIVREEIKNKNS
jgi:tetratricopeptide (TPR) repeat protein